MGQWMFQPHLSLITAPTPRWFGWVWTAWSRLFPTCTGLATIWGRYESGVQKGRLFSGESRLPALESRTLTGSFSRRPSLRPRRALPPDNSQPSASLPGQQQAWDGAAGDEHASAGLLLILKKDDGQMSSIVFPEPGFPRIFVQFPINETGALPFNIVLESKFNPKQERDGITMNLDDRRLLKAALSAFPSLVEYAVNSGWENAHRLAFVDVPLQAPRGGNRSVGGTGLVERSNRRSSPRQRASKPIISTSKGYLPAISGDDEFVSFPVPAVGGRRNDSLSTTTACMT